MTLSLAMIVRNSENVLDRCLKSCHDLFDEIIIVDTGSIDNTKNIALKYTDKVYDFEWTNDFSAARNFSFEKCTSDFIMWLDDDDIILEKDKKKIRQLDLEKYDTVICKYQYSHDEFGVVECSLERERILRRLLNFRWIKKIHECLPLLGRLLRTDIEIHHYKMHVSSERNLSILKEIVKDSQEPRDFFYLGKELADFDKHEEAIEYLEKFVTMNGWWEDTFNDYDTLSRCYMSLNKIPEFFRCVFKSIEIEPRRAEPFYILGEFYASRNDWNKAIHWFEECLIVRRSEELLSTYYPQYYTWKPALWLVICYNNIGNIKKANEYNEKFLTYRPNDSRGHNNRMIFSNSSFLVPKKDGQGKKLNLGCGNKRVDGYVSVDIYSSDNVDEVFNLNEVPYFDSTISAIYCEHALEHIGHEQAKQAIREWFRVLQPGGELLLFIPDLELCCKNYLSSDNSKLVNGIPDKDWYKYTIYGYQKDANGSLAQYQFHLTGFSKQEIRLLLEEIGFIIDYLENY